MPEVTPLLLHDGYAMAEICFPSVKSASPGMSRDVVEHGHARCLQVACDSYAVDGRCYSVYDKQLSWSKARQRCDTAGGDVALISNEEQQLALKSVMGQCESVWLGLSGREEEESWEWVDGRDVTYKVWGDNEPRRRKGRQAAVLSLNGGNIQWKSSSHKTGGAGCYACSFSPSQVWRLLCRIVSLSFDEQSISCSLFVWPCVEGRCGCACRCFNGDSF